MDFLFPSGLLGGSELNLTMRHNSGDISLLIIILILVTKVNIHICMLYNFPVHFARDWASTCQCMSVANVSEPASALAIDVCP